MLQKVDAKEINTHLYCISSYVKIQLNYGLNKQPTTYRIVGKLKELLILVWWILKLWMENLVHQKQKLSANRKYSDFLPTA